MSDDMVIITFKDKRVKGKFKAIRNYHYDCGYKAAGRDVCYFYTEGLRRPAGVDCNSIVFERVDEQ